MSTMEHIFHEKQEGSLCAQHCLNALLQGSYYTAVELASLAQQLDDEERFRMSECGQDSDEYRRFLAQPSGNMDDSGYFSVQVISNALRVWGLEMVPYRSTEPRAVNAHQNPDRMDAYICNYRNHWLTVRRFGTLWFNLNSLLPQPEQISSTYLSLFLAQLEQEGYSIFVVFGELPRSKADELLARGSLLNVATSPTTSTATNIPATATININCDDEEMQRAIQMSLEVDSAADQDQEEEETLKQAIQLSLEGNDEDDDAELKTAILMSLESIST